MAIKLVSMAPLNEAVLTVMMMGAGLSIKGEIEIVNANALIINVARGKIVDESALARAQRKKRIAGATTEAKVRIIGAAIGNIVKVLNGEKPDFVINNV